MRRIFAGFTVLACLIAQDKKPDKKPGLPLKPERKIEFTVDEGSWLSLSVSPDGKTILFDLLGDLYTVRSLAAKPRASLAACLSTASRSSRPTAS